MDEIIAKIPKAELHVHIEGTITPDMARRKAAQHGLALPADIFTPDGKAFTWTDFADCVTRVYDAVASTVRTPQDYEDITHDYLVRCADEGVIYVEFIISADHAGRMGISYKDMVDAMARGIDKARAESGIEARMNAAIVRHLPPKDIQEAAEEIVSYRHPYVTGLDLAGAEKAGDIPAFRAVFKYIKEKTQGALGWRVHAAEAAGPENAADAVSMHVKRLGHGVRAIEDKKVLDEIIRQGVVLEICPTSNILAGIYPSYDQHPLRKLFDAGVNVTLNSDDPGLFGCTVGGEYQLAHDKFCFTPRELLGCTRTAIEAAFVDEPTRRKLLRKVDDYDFFLRRRRGNGPSPFPRI